MLRKLKIENFKSLASVEVNLPKFAVLFGPNAAGKSNFLDAVQALSRIATSRTLSDALSEPIRGFPIESFAFPPGGLTALLSKDSAEFKLEAELDVGKEHARYRYFVTTSIIPPSGILTVADEYLTTLSKRGITKGNPSIENIDGQLRIRRKSKPANPRREKIGLNYAMVSDARLSGAEYRAIEKCRNEMSGWRTYYLDPRVAMRSARPPSDVRDIGVLGEDIAPFLYRLKVEKPKYFESAKRALRSLIPSVEDLTVDLDKRRGSLDIQIKQNGTDYSSRIVSEGTLRVLALCALTVNPWSGSLLAFEEPENGVHPRRLELIIDLLLSISMERGTQIIVTTHSPLLCDALLRRCQSFPDDIALLQVRQKNVGTEIRHFDVAGPLFRDSEIRQALTTSTEDGLFGSLLLRGLLDE